MGQVKILNLAVLAVMLIITAAVVYARPEPRIPKRKATLNSVMNVPGCSVITDRPISPQVIDALHLDDYLLRTFKVGAEEVTLYVGYYLSQGKVGAAHDPMVCFPGQGWKISSRYKGTINVGEQKVPYSAMVAEKDDSRELVLYWFQAYDTANPDTLRQKISLLRAKMLNQGMDNAFVRVTLPLGKRSPADVQRVVEEFVAKMYPVLLKHVREGGDTRAARATPEATC